MCTVKIHPTIRDINPQSQAEIHLVAERMRHTLMEVLGNERGSALYSMDWLIKRVLFHLDPSQCLGRVMVVEHEGLILGHCIVRLEKDDACQPFGLFSTTYVEPHSRKLGLAQGFLEAGETWMRVQNLRRAATDTDLGNKKLIQLFQRNGYQIVFRNDEMLRLEKILG